MGKRSEFERIDKDFYRTIDPRAGRAIKPLLEFYSEKTYSEPCCGDFDLVHQLNDLGMECIWHDDISSGTDALEVSYHKGDCIITNPPWSRDILHKMIDHFTNFKPTYLLFDSDWAFTKQSVPYMKYCTDIVAIGRLIWIPGTTMSGKDNCSWYRFEQKDKPVNYRINFHGRDTWE